MIQAVCPHCGNDGSKGAFYAHELVPVLYEVRPTIDGEGVAIDYTGDSRGPEWDAAEPDPSHPGYSCAACGAAFSVFQVVGAEVSAR